MAAGPGALYEVLTAQDELQLIVERVVVYASQRYHQDMGNRRYQEMSGRAQAAAAQVSDAMSFVSPEILAIGKEKLETFFRRTAGAGEIPPSAGGRAQVPGTCAFPGAGDCAGESQEMADSLSRFSWRSTMRILILARLRMGKPGTAAHFLILQRFYGEQGPEGPGAGFQKAVPCI